MNDKRKYVEEDIYTGFRKLSSITICNGIVEMKKDEGDQIEGDMESQHQKAALSQMNCQFWN